MLVRLVNENTLVWNTQRVQAATGSAGIVPAGQKIEGDGTTPADRWTLRRVLYRADRLAAPETGLPVTAIRPDDGWCDDPADPAYNRPVRLPYPASCEALWRDDHVYDMVVVLDHNDHPPIPGRGSAVFIHLARDGFPPTRGCVALAEPDLRNWLKGAGPDSQLEIMS